MVYKSSAGSGKTFTLVKEYLKLALYDAGSPPQQYKKILAITFTNKAAGEMKERILKALRDIAEKNGNSSVLAKLLSIEISCSNEELAERAAILLSEILHNYSDFSISTIDSFTHKIVKTFAHDLKLPVNFNIETNTDLFFDKVVSGLLSKIGDNPGLTNILIQYVRENATENNAWDPESKLKEFTRFIKEENAQEFLIQLNKLSETELAEIKKEISEFRKEFTKTIRLSGKKASELIKKNQLRDENFFQSSKGPQKSFEKWMNFNGNDASGLIGTHLKNAVEQNKWQNTKNTPGENTALQNILPELMLIASSTIAYINEKIERYTLYQLIERNFFSLLLLTEMQKITEEFKNEEQVVFISEFNTKIAEVINEEPAPFIFERMGERYQHFLLDEFQDTSTLQWLNLLPLIDNSLASGKYNLIVGDGKQSIYRWRNANVRQFSNLPYVLNPNQNTLLKEREQSLIRNYREEVLNVNFRSKKEIVDFNNRFFETLPQNVLSPEYFSIYKNHKQTCFSNKGGYIAIHTGRLPKEDVNKNNLALINKKIEEAIRLQYHLKDICIIVRNNRHGSEIAEYLSSIKIPVISSDSLLLSNNPEIHCLISFLKYLNNPGDHIQAAVILEHIIDDNNLLPLYLEKLKQEKSIWNILKESDISLNPDSFWQKNTFDCCLEIIRELKLEKKSPQYIRFFLDQVNEYLVHNSGSLNDFISWWEIKKETASLIIPEGMNAITIMTIHRSKGLEFPVVIIPFCNWQVFKSGSAWVNLSEFEMGLPAGILPVSEALNSAGLSSVINKERDEQFLDNINLLYVAFTRAVDQLHIIAYVSETASGKTVSDWIAGFLNTEITSGTKSVEFGTIQINETHVRKNTPELLDLQMPPFYSNTDLIKVKSSRKLKISNETENAREKGILMHYILSEINNINQIPDVLEKMLLKGLIEQPDKNMLEEKISIILNHPVLQPYFSNESPAKNESEILLANGDVLRPDRVIFEKEKTIIIDYKTGKYDPEKHNLQMQKYTEALSEMGYPTVKKILVFPEEEKVIELN